MSEVKNEVMTLDIKVKLENTMVGEYIASLVQADKLEEFLTTYTLAHLEGSFISSYGRNLTEKMLEDSVMNSNFDMDFDDELDSLFDKSKGVIPTSFNPTEKEDKNNDIDNKDIDKDTDKDTVSDDDDYDDMFLNNDESKDRVSDYGDLFDDMDDLIAEEENVNNGVQNKKDDKNSQTNQTNHEGDLQFIDEEDDDDDYESMFLSNDDENKEKKIDTSIFDDDDIIEEEEIDKTKEADKTKETDKTILTNECAQLLLSKMEEILNKLDKGVAVGAMPVIGANLSRPAKPLTKKKTTVEDINPTEEIDEEDGSDLLNNLNWDDILEINLKLSGGE